MLANIARFSFRHRWLVLFIWLAVLVGITVWSQVTDSGWSMNFRVEGSDSQDAMDLLENRFPAQSGANGDLVFKADAGISDPEVQQRVEEVISNLEQAPHVAAVVSPYSPEGATQISPDGRIARAVIQFDLNNNEISMDNETVGAVEDIVAGESSGDVQFELAGSMFEGHPEPGASEIIGVVAAIIILLIAFGSVLAMALPIITALFGIGIGVAAVALLAHLVSMPNMTTELAAMIGIGVGIDYALFIVTRYRQGLHDKFSPMRSTFQAMNTAGRSVMFAGIIVVISLMGMVLMNISFIQGMGIGAAVVVTLTMLASITLLPAVLGFVGKRIDNLRIPGTGRQAGIKKKGVIYRWSRFIERRPWPVLLIGLALIIALALPVLSIRLGSSDASSRPESDTTRRAYDLLVEGFGAGYNGPLLLAAGIDGQEDLATLQEVQEQAAADENVIFASPAMPNEDFSAAVMQVIPKTSPQDEETLELINRLRDDVIPAATEGTDVEVHVGGVTAVYDDMSQIITDRLPVFIGAVLALSFILLMVIFRSVAIPIKAVVLNLLSISAAYGMVVIVFQWGYGKDLLGVGATGPIESFLPMMLFAILFGLSMDYEVFLLSRIKEEYDRTKNNSEAIAQGLIRTARVITAAAAIMVTVFGSFALQDQRVIKEFGFGLAAAILIDASIVRMLLVPATMQIMGRLNWWLPSWLSWLPRVHVDGNNVEVAKEEKIDKRDMGEKSEKADAKKPAYQETN